jgi:hypothetical protein
MFKLRKSNERGRGEHGWLDSRHTFSFANYHDPGHMGFRSLRVINEDRVAPGRGFGAHGHDNMEIVSCVLEGALEHRDSMGNGSVLRPGMLQRMSAGAGIRHSEFNHSKHEPVHFYQIWLLPERQGAEPGYEEKTFAPDDKRGRLRLVASPGGDDGSLRIGQDVKLYLAELAAGQTVTHALATGRHAWLQVTRGRVTVNGQAAEAGDGLAAGDETQLTIASAEPDGGTAEILLFDLA